MTQKKEKRENPLWNIAFNIVIPILVLNKFSKPEYMGAVYALLLALAFPLGYFLYDLFKRKTTNFISILGFVGILLTGIIGVFQLPTEWIAIKEASIPLIIGIAVIATIKSPFPLLKKLLYNPSLMKTEVIDRILEEKNAQNEFDKILVRSSYMLAGSFFLSAVLNFVLAKIIMQSPAGTPEFNAEYSKMLSLSYPVIALPSTIVMGFVIWYLFRSLKRLTGLTMEEMFAIEG